MDDTPKLTWKGRIIAVGMGVVLLAFAAEGVLRATPDPGTEQIRASMASNICRCTGYIKIIEAVQAAARELAP